MSRSAPGPRAVYPDLVLWSLERGHRLQAVVEVETGESVNHLEALAQWAHLSKLRAAFHLYVPAGMVDVARRLCEDNQIRRRTKSGAFTPSATRFASRSSIAARKPPPGRPTRGLTHRSARAAVAAAPQSVRQPPRPPRSRPAKSQSAVEAGRKKTKPAAQGTKAREGPEAEIRAVPEVLARQTGLRALRSLSLASRAAASRPASACCSGSARRRSQSRPPAVSRRCAPRARSAESGHPVRLAAICWRRRSRRPTSSTGGSADGPRRRPSRRRAKPRRAAAVDEADGEMSRRSGGYRSSRRQTRNRPPQEPLRGRCRRRTQSEAGEAVSAASGAGPDRARVRTSQAGAAAAAIGAAVEVAGAGRSPSEPGSGARADGPESRTSSDRRPKRYNSARMKLKTTRFLGHRRAHRRLAIAAVAVSAQTPGPAQPAPAQPRRTQPTFRVQVDLGHQRRRRFATRRAISSRT